MINSRGCLLVTLLVTLLVVLIAVGSVGCNQSSDSELDSQGRRQSTDDLIAELDNGTTNGQSELGDPLERKSAAENRAASVASADVCVLFLGNSHTRPIPELLEEIFADYHPDKKVFFQMGSGFGFLAEQAKSEGVRKEITEHQWDFVVLQAQKYSTTGKYDYPIDGAVELAKLAISNGSRVIMYPEFPRQDVDEYHRIRRKHEEIAKKADVTIAPIGEAWSKAIDRLGSESLYSADGNHASRKGYQIVASVIFLLTGQGETPGNKIEDTQLMSIAKETVSEM